jgi:N6-L-threonylcarbamoyladenine synthase
MMEKPLRILGIETSCDETGVALYDEHHGLVAEELRSQEVHQRYGGVVPELASRDHILHLSRLVRACLAGQPRPDAVAYTAGPGLLGALLVGANVARGLARGWGVPAVAVHHLEGHIMAAHLDGTALPYPWLVLLVSGGHSMLVHVARFGHYRILGQTQDDAAGEAFDKCAKVMGLPYPGGPALAALAASGRPGRFSLPAPMAHDPGLDMSFSGLKTAFIRLFRSHAELLQNDQQARADLALALQEAIASSLTSRLERALLQPRAPRHVIGCGGVLANAHLRALLLATCQRHDAALTIPAARYCTDNGAMVAMAGALRLRHGLVMAQPVQARWALNDLTHAPAMQEAS